MKRLRMYKNKKLNNIKNNKKRLKNKAIIKAKNLKK
jgi:hypothetical protein